MVLPEHCNLEMLTTELKKSGSNDVVVHGKLIINISSNIANPSTAARTYQPTASSSHQRTPSVHSGVSSSGASSSNNRTSMQPTPNSGTPTNASPNPSTAAANGGRELSPFEDQYGALPKK